MTLEDRDKELFWGHDRKHPFPPRKHPNYQGPDRLIDDNVIAL